jgi:hypothetical protein
MISQGDRMKLACGRAVSPEADKARRPFFHYDQECQGFVRDRFLVDVIA